MRSRPRLRLIALPLRCVDPHARKILTKTGLKEGARLSIQRASRFTQNVVDNRRRSDRSQAHLSKLILTGDLMLFFFFFLACRAFATNLRGVITKGRGDSYLAFASHDRQPHRPRAQMNRRLLQSPASSGYAKGQSSRESLRNSTLARILHGCPEVRSHSAGPRSRTYTPPSDRLISTNPIRVRTSEPHFHNFAIVWRKSHSPRATVSSASGQYFHICKLAIFFGLALTVNFFPTGPWRATDLDTARNCTIRQN